MIGPIVFCQSLVSPVSRKGCDHSGCHYQGVCIVRYILLRGRAVFGSVFELSAKDYTQVTSTAGGTHHEFALLVL